MQSNPKYKLKEIPIFGSPSSECCEISEKGPRPYIPAAFPKEVFRLIYDIANPGFRNRNWLTSSKYFCLMPPRDDCNHRTRIIILDRRSHQMAETSPGGDILEGKVNAASILTSLVQLGPQSCGEALFETRFTFLTASSNERAWWTRQLLNSLAACEGGINRIPHVHQTGRYATFRTKKES